LGFVGVAMLLRPVFASEQTSAGLIGLASGFFAACAYMNVKKLGDAGEPAWRVVFYFSLVGMIGSALVQPFDGPFHAVNARNLWTLLGVGLSATLAQLALTRAYQSGNTLVVGAFAYSTVIFAALLGLFFFDDQLPWLAWLGMLVIIVSGIIAVLAKGASGKLPALPAEED
jgi:drug/metabolite transporter (DMT)-like permease